MIIANKTQIERFLGKAEYSNGAKISDEAAKINHMLFVETDGQFPCYAARIGKRGAIVWVSVGSSARISRGEAQRMIGACGGSLENIEIWWDFGLDDSDRVK